MVDEKETPVTKRNPIAKDLRTPKYAPRVVKDKKKEASRNACRKETF